MSRPDLPVTSASDLILRFFLCTPQALVPTTVVSTASFSSQLRSVCYNSSTPINLCLLLDTVSYQLSQFNPSCLTLTDSRGSWSSPRTNGPSSRSRRCACGIQCTIDLSDSYHSSKQSLLVTAMSMLRSTHVGSAALMCTPLMAAGEMLQCLSV